MNRLVKRVNWNILGGNINRRYRVKIGNIGKKKDGFYDLIALIVTCLIEWKLPHKYIGEVKIGSLVACYSVITTHKSPIDSVISQCYDENQIFFDKNLSFKKSLLGVATNNGVNILYADLLKSFVALRLVYNKPMDEIYFHKFKLQDISDYKIEKRNKLINKVLENESCDEE